ncbi:emp24 gp25L p24 family protein [Babesia ovis]|uniref:Emp24 gp25L p24 family protein n=1 Tax=Babesia ovis TaxID=5869 RepID=A0A9W5T8Q5_BABOV|nr:emp24 gp25L p24 family protein [Babesia ovis]
MARLTAFGALLSAALAACIGFGTVSAGYLDVTTLIKAKKRVCFVEPIGKEMYTHITVRALDVKDDRGVAVVIKEEGGEKPIYEEANLLNHLSVSFTAVHGLSAVCCIAAFNHDTYVALSIKTGADARDYSIIAKSSHLDPVDAHLQNAIDEFSAFHKAQITGSRSMDRTSKKAADAYNMLTKFAIANSIFVVISTMCVILYFRSFFLSKKVM